MLACYHFKLKYLNQNLFLPYIKKTYIYIYIHIKVFWLGKKNTLKKRFQSDFIKLLESQINQVLPNFYSSQSFILPGLVQLSDLTFQVRRSLITLQKSEDIDLLLFNPEISIESVKILSCPSPLTF